MRAVVACLQNDVDGTVLFSNTETFLAVRGLSPSVADLLEAVPNGPSHRLAKLLPERYCGEAVDGLLAARQDHFAEVLFDSSMLWPADYAW